MEGSTTQNKWIAIINPVSGAGRGGEEWPKVEAMLRENGILPECRFTQHRYHAIELTVEAIAAGYRNIIAAGGDGTLHEVVNGVLFQRDVPPQEITVGAISLGTGNDWGRMYGFTQDCRKAVEAIAAGHTFLQDVGNVTFYECRYPHDRHVVNIAGAGFDSVVVRQFDKLKEKGDTKKAQYMWCLLKALMSYRTKRMRITVDGVQVADGKIFTVAVGIGRYNGGGMMQLPLSVADDGLFDITVIRKLPKLTVIRKLRTLFNGTIYSVRQASHHRGRHILIEAAPGTMAEADGELLGDTPSELTIIPKALRIIVPADFVSVTT